MKRIIPFLVLGATFAALAAAPRATGLYTGEVDFYFGGLPIPD